MPFTGVCLCPVCYSYGEVVLLVSGIDRSAVNVAKTWLDLHGAEKAGRGGDAGFLHLFVCLQCY